MTEHYFNRVPSLSYSRRTPLLALYGGPGTGKSTTAALLFAAYKQTGLNVELVPEVAKDYTWEKAHGRLNHQALICAEQMWRYDRLDGQVDLVITDTSTLLGLHHCAGTPSDTPAFHDWIVDDYRRRNTINVFLTRNPMRPYNPSGRRQSEDSAKHVDTELRKLLGTLGIDHLTVQVGVLDDTYIDRIVQYTDKRLPGARTGRVSCAVPR